MTVQIDSLKTKIVASAEAQTRVTNRDIQERSKKGMGRTPDENPATLAALRKYLRQAKQDWGSWESVRRHEYPLVPRGTLWRIAQTDYTPTRPELLKRLELPMLAPAPVCPTCGIVHVSRYCPARTMTPRRLSKAARRKRLWRSTVWRTICAERIAR